jgi:hypothetical protein
MPGENGHRPKFKIPPVRVSADDCPVQTSAGEQLFLHVGEWVEVLPVETIRLRLVLQHVGETADMVAHNEFCDLLSRRVTAWNLTDVVSDPLPQPWRNPDAIRELSATEQLWLLRAMEGNTEGQRKNGSGGSGDTTLTKARSREKSSSP